MPLLIRRIAQADVVAGFRSGERSVDLYLKRYARLNEDKGFSANFVAVEDGAVVGFVTVVGVSIPQVLIADLAPGLPRYDAPVLLLAQMGVQVERQGSGVGKALMRKVYEEAQAHSVRGCVGVVTDALPGAVAFYEKHRFKTIEPPSGEGRPTRMFRPLLDIREDVLR